MTKEMGLPTLRFGAGAPSAKLFQTCNARDLAVASEYGKGDSSRLDQWIGFVGAMAFIALLIVTQIYQ
jgi:hypothetical protein